MHRLIRRLAEAMAIAGGIVLSVLILLTCASIIGREANAFLNGDLMQSAMPGIANWILSTGIGPVNGDFELVEAGVAFAIFAFIPLTQITAGHATVDIFTARLGPRSLRLLRAVIEIVFAAVLILIAVQLFGGMLSKREHNETTFLLQFPTWWSYAASLVAASAAALCGVYMAGVRVAEAMTGRVIVADGPEADH